MKIKQKIPIAREILADMETPLSIFRKLANGPYSYLFESVEGGENLGRWSVVASDPLWIAKANGDHLTRTWRSGQSESIKGNPFEGLRSWLTPYKTAFIPGLPRLGQLYGMWGYELIRWIEEKVPVHEDGSNEFPDGIWMLMDSILIVDQVKRLITAVSYYIDSNKTCC